MSGLVGYGSSDEEDSMDEGDRQTQLKSQVRGFQAARKSSLISPLLT